jgi:hypothetical protein
MRNKILLLYIVVLLLWPIASAAQTAATQAASVDDSDARPPVTEADLKIVKRAREILDSTSKWNRADNRVCPKTAKTFSLYCALQVATNEVTGKTDHRGAALQETRFVVDEIIVGRNYAHRLMDYNNDPTTTFNDIQEVFGIVERLITLRLKNEHPTAVSGTAAPVAPSEIKPAVTEADIEIIKRARRFLDTPAKQNHSGSQNCPADATTLNLYCALVKAATEVTGTFDEQLPAIKEAKRAIVETAPNAKSYKARLIDFNNDPTVTFADVQKLLQLVEDRLTKQLSELPKKQ